MLLRVYTGRSISPCRCTPIPRRFNAFLTRNSEPSDRHPIFGPLDNPPDPWPRYWIVYWATYIPSWPANHNICGCAHVPLRRVCRKSG